MLNIRLGWVVCSVVIAVGGSLIVGVLVRRRRFQEARLVSLGVLMYALVLMLLWATESPHLFLETQERLDRTLKLLLLAVSGGLLAQVAIWFDRVARGQVTDDRVAPMYLDALTGALTGAALAALVWMTIGFPSGESGDVRSAVAGVAGGWMGLGAFDLLKRALPGGLGAKEPSAPVPTPPAGTTSRTETCLYAGQAYSHGATVTMPSANGPVVKICDAKNGQWTIES